MEATIVVEVDIPLPGLLEVEASGLIGGAAALSSPLVGDFMAISQSVRCCCVPFARFRVGIAWGLGEGLGESFSVPVGSGLLVRLLIDVRSGGILGALRTAGSSRKPAFFVRFSLESRVGLAGGMFRG